MDTNSNRYTYIFAVLMVVVLAGLLAFTATQLKPIQDRNIKAEKMQNILGTIGVNVDRAAAADNFKKYIKESLSLKEDGTNDEDVLAFDINLKKELKKASSDQRFPIYIAKKEGKTFYIIPLYGAGLWDAIWGYVALDSDRNTIVGANFDHKGETPGLGAEITTAWFQKQFQGKKIFSDSNQQFVSVKTVKGGAPAGDLHAVDAISGGTITSDGVSNMIRERLSRYLPYLEKK